MSNSMLILSALILVSLNYFAGTSSKLKANSDKKEISKVQVSEDAPVKKIVHKFKHKKIKSFSKCKAPILKN